MTSHTAPLTWTDAASRGTRIERALLVVADGLTRIAAHSARRRAERAEVGESYADLQRERMRLDAVRLGVHRR